MSFGALEAIALALIAGILWASWRQPSPGALRRAGEKFAAENLAYVDSEFVLRFDEVGIQIRRARGVFLAVVVAVFWFVLKQGIDWDPGTSVLLLFFAGAIAVVAVGYLFIAGREFPAPAGRQVVARMRHVRLTDYVPPSALLACAAYVVMACSVGGVAIVAAGQHDGPAWLQPRGGVGIAVVSFVFAALIAMLPVYLQIVCSRPETAVDPAHLYLQDAWRSVVVRRVFLAVGLAMVNLVQQTPYIDAVGDWDYRFHLVGLVVVPALFAFVEWRSKLWFRKRLWPELAPGQVLLPGERVAA